MRQGGAMVTEHALLPVVPGREEEFEEAFARARPLITASPGCHGVSLSRGVESPGTYLLLVGWDSVGAHEVGFRGSPAHQEWKRLLHRFYEPFPVVEHFEPVDPTGAELHAHGTDAERRRADDEDEPRPGPR